MLIVEPPAAQLGKALNYFSSVSPSVGLGCLFYSHIVRIDLLFNVCKELKKY